MRIPGIVIVVLLLTHTSSGTSKNIYYIGNSLTDNIKYSGLQFMAKQKGHTLNWGRHMIPGAPLEWIRDHPDDGFSEPPYGYYPEALDDYTWDFLSLQPFDRTLAEDTADIKAFMNMAYPRSPEATALLYAHWPRSNGTVSASGYNALWNATYSGGWKNLECRSYYEKLMILLRKSNLKVIMVPVGEVMYRLNQQASEGAFGSFSSIFDLYEDEIHLTGTGCYIAACTYFACIFQEQPAGLPVPSEYGAIAPEVVLSIQETVWDVVSTYSDSSGTPWSGVGTATPVNPTDPPQDLTINSTARLPAPAQRTLRASRGNSPFDKTVFSWSLTGRLYTGSARSCPGLLLTRTRRHTLNP